MHHRRKSRTSSFCPLRSCGHTSPCRRTDHWVADDQEMCPEGDRLPTKTRREEHPPRFQGCGAIRAGPAVQCEARLSSKGDYIAWNRTARREGLSTVLDQHGDESVPLVRMNETVLDVIARERSRPPLQMCRYAWFWLDRGRRSQMTTPPRMHIITQVSCHGYRAPGSVPPSEHGKSVLGRSKQSDEPVVQSGRNRPKVALQGHGARSPGSECDRV